MFNRKIMMVVRISSSPNNRGKIIWKETSQLLLIWCLGSLNLLLIVLLVSISPYSLILSLCVLYRSLMIIWKNLRLILLIKTFLLRHWPFAMMSAGIGSFMIFLKMLKKNLISIIISNYFLMLLPFLHVIFFLSLILFNTFVQSTNIVMCIFVKCLLIRTQKLISQYLWRM